MYMVFQYPNFQGSLAAGGFLPDKFIFANYIVRIYRFKKDDPRGLVGVVEEVGIKGKRAFTNYDELWEILNSPAAPSPARPRGDGRLQR
jgi:hypothetical protein